MKKSSGILVYRKRNAKIEILLVHPGGHYWRNKDKNSWNIPKGEIIQSIPNKTKINNNILDKSLLNQQDSAFIIAINEFEEETGLKLAKKDKEKIKYFGEVKNANKIVYIFILEKDFGDNLKPKSNLIKIEWPPRSGKIIKIPEVDKASYFDLETAKEKLVSYQKEIIDKLKFYLEKN